MPEFHGGMITTGYECASHKVLAVAPFNLQDGVMHWNQMFAARSAVSRRSAIREILKLTEQPGMISFAGGLPAAELFPREALRAVADKVLNEHPEAALQYSATEGIAPLRDWLAASFSTKGAGLTRENVLIVSGAQQALYLTGQVFLEAGDRVIVENPTYLALLSAWRSTGVEFVPVNSDEDGLCVDELSIGDGPKPKLIYCVPNFQNPQGVTLSGSRREQLVDFAVENQVGILEDDPYGKLRYSGEELPSLFEFASARFSGTEFPVINAGTFSKVLAPGLRVGWVIAPTPVIDALVRAKQALDLHTSTLNQWLACELVQSGFLDQHVPILRRSYEERRDAMLSALEEFMPEGVSWTRPEGGMFLLLRLPGQMDATALLKKALEKKVAFVPGEEFHLAGNGSNTMRLNFTNADSAMIRTGISRLAQVVCAEIKPGAEILCDSPQSCG